jgi:hypothetical protein
MRTKEIAQIVETRQRDNGGNHTPYARNTHTLHTHFSPIYAYKATARYATSMALRSANAHESKHTQNHIHTRCTSS